MCVFVGQYRKNDDDVDDDDDKGTKTSNQIKVNAEHRQYTHTQTCKTYTSR